MKAVKITAVRRACHADLIEQYENPLETPCETPLGQSWISYDGEQPEGFCNSAWQSVGPFVKELAMGGGNFYDGWMKDPYSAMVSCNDGFRPVSFYVEVVRGEAE